MRTMRIFWQPHVGQGVLQIKTLNDDIILKMYEMTQIKSPAIDLWVMTQSFEITGSRQHSRMRRQCFRDTVMARRTRRHHKTHS